MSIYSVDKLMAETRRLAREYRRATGKTLAVTGEIARYDAARLLALDLVEDHNAGHDARARCGGRAVQIKGRVIFDASKSSPRIGQIRREGDWQSVVLVLMDSEFEPFEIYEADREAVLDAVDGAASGSRVRRGALSVAKFRAISRLAWSRDGDAQANVD